MRRGRKGNMALESILWIPFILLLLVGMVQFGKMVYVYYTVKKVLYTAGTYVASQQGVDFCGDATGIIAAAKGIATTGTTDGSGDVYLANLTADNIDISAECVDPTSQSVGQCSLNCDGAAGNPRPDFVVVSIPNGYQFPLRIPYILLDPILMRPTIRIAFEGT